MTDGGPPAVSIGLPVFNGAAFLDAAIGTLLAQDFADFELIISDNASTDNTQAICERWAARDQRIRYVRQPTNLGPLPNFVYVLEHARADLFMWAAADDIRSADFVRVNYVFLCANPDYVGSISRTWFEGHNESSQIMGDDVLDAPTVGRRMARFLHKHHPNSLFYAMFRRDLLLQSLTPIAWYFGFDWSVMLRLTQLGPVKCLDEGWLQRGVKGWSNQPNIIARSRTRKRHWLLPCYDLTVVILPLLRKVDPSSRRQVLLSLLRLNVKTSLSHAAHEVHKLLRRRAA